MVSVKHSRSLQSLCQCSAQGLGLILLQVTSILEALKTWEERPTWLTCSLLFTRSNISSLHAFHSTSMSSHPFLRIHRALSISVIATISAIKTVQKEDISSKHRHEEASLYTCPLGKKKQCLEDCST